MEDILGLVLSLGGLTLIFLAFSPIGRALADRIRGAGSAPMTDPAVGDELARLRNDVAELQERVDFTERMLAQRGEAGRLPGAS